MIKILAFAVNGLCVFALLSVYHVPMLAAILLVFSVGILNFIDGHNSGVNAIMALEALMGRISRNS